MHVRIGILFPFLLLLFGCTHKLGLVDFDSTKLSSGTYESTNQVSVIFHDFVFSYTELKDQAREALLMRGYEFKIGCRCKLIIDARCEFKSNIPGVPDPLALIAITFWNPDSNQLGIAQFDVNGKMVNAEIIELKKHGPSEWIKKKEAIQKNLNK